MTIDHLDALQVEAENRLGRDAECECGRWFWALPGETRCDGCEEGS